MGLYIMCCSCREHQERKESKEQLVTKGTQAPLAHRVLLEHLDPGYANSRVSRATVGGCEELLFLLLSAYQIQLMLLKSYARAHVFFTPISKYIMGIPIPLLENLPNGHHWSQFLVYRV